MVDEAPTTLISAPVRIGRWVGLVRCVAYDCGFVWVGVDCYRLGTDSRMAREWFRLTPDEYGTLGAFGKVDI
jgi:hypothetical protein